MIKHVKAIFIFIAVLISIALVATLCTTDDAEQHENKVFSSSESIGGHPHNFEHYIYLKQSMRQKRRVHYLHDPDMAANTGNGMTWLNYIMESVELIYCQIDNGEVSHYAGDFLVAKTPHTVVVKIAELKPDERQYLYDQMKSEETIGHIEWQQKGTPDEYILMEEHDNDNGYLGKLIEDAINDTSSTFESIDSIFNSFSQH